MSVRLLDSVVVVAQTDLPLLTQLDEDAIKMYTKEFEVCPLPQTLGSPTFSLLRRSLQPTISTAALTYCQDSDLALAVAD